MSTMECAEARSRMLEADVTELQGTGFTALSQHIIGCGECRARAQRILRGYADLERGLQQFGTAAPKRRFRRLWIPVPLAAAAALAVFIAQQKREPIPEIALVTARMFQAQPVVTPPEGTQAIIIEKNDLTVVWLY